MGRAFGTWHAAVVQQSEERQKMQRMVLYWTHATLGKAFSSWREHATRNADLKGRMQHLVLRWSNSTLSKAFSSWREHATRNADLKGRMQRLVLHWSNSTLSRAFSSWREWAAEQPAKRSKLQRMVLHWTHSTMSKAFGTWHQWAVKHAGKPALLQRMLLHWTNATLSRAFAGWHEAAAHKAEKKAVLQRMVLHWSSGMLGKAFGTWHGWTLARKEKAAKLQKVRLRLPACLATWLQHCALAPASSASLLQLSPASRIAWHSSALFPCPLAAACPGSPHPDLLPAAAPAGGAPLAQHGSRQVLLQLAGVRWREAGAQGQAGACDGALAARGAAARLAQLEGRHDLLAHDEAGGQACWVALLWLAHGLCESPHLYQCQCCCVHEEKGFWAHSTPACALLRAAHLHGSWDIVAWSRTTASMPPQTAVI